MGVSKRKQAVEVSDWDEPIEPKRKAVEVSDWDEEPTPVKKKDEIPSGPFKGIYQNVEYPSTGRLPSEKKHEPQKIEEYNRQFEEITGHKDFSLSEPVKPKGLIGQDLYEKRKQSFEEKKFLVNQEREKEIMGVQSKVATGTVKPEELSALYEKPYGTKIVQQTLNEFAPEAGGYGLSQEVFGHEKKWDEAAKAINIKNRPQGVEAQNQYFYNLDNELSSQLENSLTAKEETVVAGRGSVREVVKNPIGKVDTNSPEELAAALTRLENSDFVADKEGKEVKGAKEKMMQQINEKLMHLSAEKEMHPEIAALGDKTKEAILRVNMKRERGEKNNPLTDEVNQHQFELGLNFIKDAKPNVYENIVRTINDKGEVAGLDYETVSKIGQQIYNQQVFRGAAQDPSLIDAETNIDYTSYDSKKADYARIIGERAKKSGGKNRREFSKDEIMNLGGDLPNQEIVKDLADEEQLWWYDAIPKSGWREALAQGVIQPIAGIKSTLQTIGESPAETYLRSKRLDVGIGGQKVSDEKGNYSDILPSDKKNVLYDIARGFGQFVPQILLTKGIGGTLAKGLSLERRVGALTAEQLANAEVYGGTIISTYAQTYGDSYMDALQKTGDPATAQLMGNINATASALFETILPDVKIADKILKGGGMAKGIVDLIKKGGDPATLATKTKGFVKKFVLEAADIERQEITEEVGTQVANYLTESIFSPATVKDRDLGDEVMDTISGTFISMLVPSLLGGGGMVMNKDFTRDGLNAAAINLSDSMNALDKALSDNSISQIEYDKSKVLLQLHSDNIKNAPKVDNKGDLLSSDEKMNYAYQDTLSQVYTDGKNNTADKAEQETFQKKLDRAEENKQRILGGEKIVPEPEEKPVITPEGVATPLEKVSGEEVQASNTDNVGGDEKDLHGMISEIPELKVKQAGTGTLYITNKDTGEVVRVGNHEPNYDAPRSHDYKEIYTHDVSGKEINKPHQVLEQVAEHFGIDLPESLREVVDKGYEQDAIDKERADKSKKEHAELQKQVQEKKQSHIPFITENKSELKDIADAAEKYGEEGSTGDKRRKRRRSYFNNKVKEKFGYDLEYSDYKDISQSLSSTKEQTTSPKEGEKALPENPEIKNEKTTTQQANTGDQPVPAGQKSSTSETPDQIKQVAAEATTIPPEPPKEEPVKDDGGKLNDKGILNHLYKAKNIPEEARKGFEAEGLQYETKSQTEAAAVAKAVVEEMGIEDAVSAAEAMKFDGDVNSLIFAEALNKLKEQEDAATTPEGKMEAAMKFAEVGITYDKMARYGGRFNAAINHFYKKSPLGIVMWENTKRKKDFDEWSKPKDKSWKDVVTDMMKEPEFETIIKERVDEELKKERSEFRKARKEKVHKAIDETLSKWADKLKAKDAEGAQKQGIGIDEIFKAVGLTIKAAYDAGVAIEKVVQDAINYISKELGNDTWGVEDFRKEQEARLGKEADRGGKFNREKRIDYLKKELERIRFRRQKEPKAETGKKREISDEEQILLDEIEAEQLQWDAEKDAARQAANDYQKMETERNRQLKRVGELNDKIETLRGGKLPEGQKREPKKDTPEIEALKVEKDALEKSVRESIAHEKKMKDLEKELQRLKDRKPKDQKPETKKELTDEERQIRDEIESERKAWGVEKNIEKLNEELNRVKNRQKKITDPKEKKELTDEEKSLVDQIKAEKELWAKEVAPAKKLIADLKAAQKSLDEYQRRIDEKDISSNKSNQPDPPQLKALKDKRDAKRKEYETMKKAMLKPAKDAEALKKKMEKFIKKLKGLTDKQKDALLTKSYNKVIEDGGLDYPELRKMIAEVTGRADLTDVEAARMKELVSKTNALEDAAQKVRTDRTDESLVQLTKAEIEAGRAAKELNELFHNKPDIIKRLTSIMQLSTLGIPALVNNPIYNVWNQMALRFPIGVVNDVIDRAMSAAATLAGRTYDREYNVWETQKEFWSKMGLGAKEAAQQFGTGLSRQDYLDKEIVTQQQIRPFKSLRDLADYAKGKKQLTRKQYWDELIQGTVGIPAEVVARTLNLGDKPQRFGAEGAQGAAFSKTLGLKDIDYKIFMKFPREEAYRAYKAQGLSDEVAGQKSDYIKEAIIKEGQRSTFQQDNILNDIISAGANMLSSKIGQGKEGGVSQLTKALVISPYIKIPSNAFWSLYNLLNPEVAILQAGIHAGRARGYSSKGELTKSKLQNREARYWMAHAIVGIAMRGVVIALVKAGTFVPGSDDDDSKKERDADAYFDKPGYVNVGGIKISNRWFGFMGMMGNAIAKKWKDATPEQREAQDDFWNVAFGGMEFEALQELQNGVFANSSSLLQSLSTGDFSRYGLNTLNMFANIIQPAAAAQYERARLDEVITSKGDSFLDKLDKNFAQRSVLYRKIFNTQLDNKRDIWGQPIPKGGNVLSRMFGISKANPQLFGRPVYDDFLRTNDSGFLPPAVLPTLNGQKLNTKQEIRLQEYIGGERKKLTEPYINNMAKIPIYNKKYSELNDEKKKDALQYLYTRGRERGLELFYEDYPEFRPKEKTIQDQIDDSLWEGSKSIMKIQEPKSNE